MNMFKNLATLGPIGYLPAPGTMATIVTVPLVWIAKSFFVSPHIYFCITAFVCALSYIIITKACAEFDCKDPSQIVIDELAGTFVAFSCAQLSVNHVIVVFCLFRFFDISKIPPISYLESYFKGPFGILIDDIAAGALAACIACLIL